jgi:hypothetical protein
MKKAAIFVVTAVSGWTAFSSINHKALLLSLVFLKSDRPF